MKRITCGSLIERQRFNFPITYMILYPFIHICIANTKTKYLTLNQQIFGTTLALIKTNDHLFLQIFSSEFLSIKVPENKIKFFIITLNLEKQAEGRRGSFKHNSNSSGVYFIFSHSQHNQGINVRLFQSAYHIMSCTVVLCTKM